VCVYVSITCNETKPRKKRRVYRLAIVSKINSRFISVSWIVTQGFVGGTILQ